MGLTPSQKVASDTGSEMDEIKLKNERDINSLIHIIRVFSNDIGMSFRLNKCRWMISYKGKMITTEGAECNITHVQGSYKIRWDPPGKWKS